MTKGRRPTSPAIPDIVKSSPGPFADDALLSAGEHTLSHHGEVQRRVLLIVEPVQRRNAREKALLSE
jgi:hypothetical protein